MGGNAHDAVRYAGPYGFSAEMERTLQVLDYAVAGHKRRGRGGYKPYHNLMASAAIQDTCFPFVNKMDQPGTDQEQRNEGSCRSVWTTDVRILPVRGLEEFTEHAAMVTKLLERYLRQGMWMMMRYAV